MKKEWLKHYVLAFAFLAIVIVSVLMLFSQIKLAGFAVYGASEACIIDIIESSYFTANQVCNSADPPPGPNGPTITTNNVVLNCSFYNLIGDSAQGFGIKASANNTIIRNCVIKTFKYDLNISGENTTVIDTNLSGSGTSDANISGIGSGINATFLNVTFTNSKATLGNDARLFVKNYLTVNVIWANGTGAIGVAVSIYNESANATQASSTTDSQGIVVFNATDYIKTSAQQEEYSYNITAISGGSNASNYSNDMSGNTLVLLNLSIASDSLRPNLTIASPRNITYSTGIMHFNVTLSENISICVYSLDSWQNNVSMTRYNDSYFNYTNLSINDGGYLARFWCNDTSNNANNSEQVSFSIDTIKPALNLTYPSNTSYNYNVIQLNYTASDVNLQVCWWSSNNGVANVTIACGTNITGANSSEGNNTWLISVNDSAGNLNFSRVTFVKDTAAPVIALISPPDGYNTTDTNMIFSYNVTDTSSIANCSLVVDNAIDQTSSSVAKNSQQNLSRAVSAASYTWSMNCTDAMNNAGNSTTRNLTINAQPPQQNTTTGGGGGGSSCTSKWQCSIWTECENGNQTRTCTDTGKCSASRIEKRSCVVANNTIITTIETERQGYCRENWTCQWKECREGWQDAYNCADINTCGTNAFEPVNRTCIEREFPLPSIPIAPAVAVGGGIVVVASLLWLWWLLLFAGLPLFMLRLRHYCLSLVDFDNLLQLDKKINRGMFISLLRQHTNLAYAGARESTERFLLDKGFVELQFSKPCIINAHFSSSKEADMFRQALIKSIDEFSKSMGIDAVHKAELIRDIALVVERQSMFSALRALRRQKRSEKVIKGAVKR